MRLARGARRLLIKAGAETLRVDASASPLTEAQAAAWLVHEDGLLRVPVLVCCLYAIKSDAAFRARYLADPEGATREAGLSDVERAALGAGDRDALVALGAHPYLVFMADLRVRMDRGTTIFEYF